jgi:guanine nucleotide-binding protein subunit alpha
MRLIHTKGFSTSERKQWKVTIFQNLVHAFQVVFGAMEEQEVEFADPSSTVCGVSRARYTTPGLIAS